MQIMHKLPHKVRAFSSIDSILQLTVLIFELR